MPTALIDLRHAGESFTVRVLLDGGAERSFISSRIQQKLGLPVQNHQAQISGLGGTVVGQSKGRCDVLIFSKNSEFSIKIRAIVVSKLSHLLPSRGVQIKNLNQLQQLGLADPTFFKPGPIDMIIGSDFLPFINSEGTQILEGCLEARASHLGWYISGPAPSEDVQTFRTSVQVADNVDLNTQLRKFWELEEIEVSQTQSDNDIYCEELFKTTTYRDSDGKYVVRLPFKKEYPQDIFLGPTKSMAFAQYNRMEATLGKTPELQAEYTAVLQEYKTLNHMEEVPGTERGEKVSSFFLPHHAVVRPESTTTKLRVVFNASKKSKTGFSLNDVLHTGPILQTDILQIITNWRFYKFVFTGDIQKMYRQIWVHKEDRPYQQILFREKPNDVIRSYQLKTVTFGINCAPFLAIRTLHELSKDVKSTNPQASNILTQEVYVDDILSGGHSLSETKSKQADLISVLSSAGFPVKKVTANHSALLEHLPREDLLNEEFLKIDNCSITKTLGIQWNAITDSFSYSVKYFEIPTSVTKRQMLSIIAKLFDPLGWIGPVIIVAKVFMQELWALKSGWDDQIPQDLLSRWKTFLADLTNISSIQIPRWVNFSLNCFIQLHAFSDASEKAYCGTIYMRTCQDGMCQSHLIVAKTRVAPLKQTTIPKLELCGAVLVTKLLQMVSKNIHVPHEATLWTDSSIVLGWIQRNPQTLKTFVANRVGEILSTTNSSQWKHIGTNDNPADLGSRGSTPQELQAKSLWWHGPHWLTLPQDQ